MKSQNFFKINLSDFARTIGYCEFYVNIIKKGIKLKIKNKKMEIGKEVHRKLEEKEKFNLPKEEILLDKKIDISLGREVPLKFYRKKDKFTFLYVGKADKVIRKDKNLIVIEDKVTKMNRVTKSMEAQILSYLYGIQRAYKISYSSLYGLINFRNENGDVIKTFNINYNIDNRIKILSYFNKFENLFLNKIKPKKGNCEKCIFKDICKANFS